MSLDRQNNNIISKGYNRLHQLNKIRKYTTFKSRLSIVNAMVMGIVSYCLPLQLNCSSKQLMKLHKLQIFACRTVMGSNCFKMSNIKLLAKCKWLSMANMIRKSSILFIHKIKSNNKISAINELFTTNKSKRITKHTYPIHEPKTKNMKNFILYKGNKLYNSIPEAIIKNKINVVKKSIKKYLTVHYHPFKLHQSQHNDANSSDSSFYTDDSE